MEVIGLLCKEFIVLIAAANFIAIPIIIFAMNRWLENFAYKIDIGWSIFALAGISAAIDAPGSAHRLFSQLAGHAFGSLHDAEDIPAADLMNLAGNDSSSLDLERA